jgi:hypothetical protein
VRLWDEKGQITTFSFTFGIGGQGAIYIRHNDSGKREHNVMRVWVWDLGGSIRTVFILEMRS